MKALRLAQDVLPIAKFKAHVSEVINRIGLDGRPTVITLNGEAAAVLISPEDFDRIVYTQHVIRGIEDGMADFEAGRVIGDDELSHWAERRFPTPAKRKRTRKSK